MDFTLSHEQHLLRDGLTSSSRPATTSTRAGRPSRPGAGWQPDIWRAFAEELGILGAALPEDVGGIGGGPVEVMVIAEALGYALVVEPYVDTAVVAAGLLRRAGGAVRTGLLESIVEGTAIVALAAAEAASGDHWQDARPPHAGTDPIGCSRAKIMAVGAPLATHLLVTAANRRWHVAVLRRRSARPGPRHPRVTARSTTVAPPTWCSTLCDCPPTRCSATRGRHGRHSSAPATRARPRCAPRRSAACARCWPTPSNTASSGTSSASRSAASRRSSTAWSTCTWSSSSPSPPCTSPCSTSRPTPRRRARAVSAAKATIGRAARFVGQNAVQLHGGMGMTEELAIGHYFKRLTAMQFEFGSTDYHVTRYAELTRGVSLRGWVLVRRDERHLGYPVPA